MKRPQKLAVMLVPTPPYEICGLGVALHDMDGDGEADLVASTNQRIWWLRREALHFQENGG